MPRIQRLLLHDVLVSFALVVLLVTGVFVAGAMLQTLQRYPDLSIGNLVLGAPLFAATALPLTTPIAFLMACLLTYGRHADDNEYLASQMAGVSPWKSCAPAIAAAVVVSIGTVELMCDVNPTLRGELKAILRGQIREAVAQMRSPSKTNVKIGDMEMSWAGRDGDWFTDVFVTWTSEERSGPEGAKTRSVNRVTAKRASVALTDEPKMRLAVTFEGAELPTDDARGTARSWTAYVDLEQRIEGKSKDEMRASELLYRMERLKSVLGKDRRSDSWDAYRLYAGEYWRRLTLGLAPLALALLGVPLGLLARRGSRAWAFVIGVAVALPVYYPLLLLGDRLSDMGVMPPAVGLQLPNLVVGVAGLVLLRHVQNR